VRRSGEVEGMGEEEGREGVSGGGWGQNYGCYITHNFM
jgi:hypothetical protein